ncbi:hypothetical protein HMPREF0239_03422 [Clostridium sp. ATCC BAA-442]|nr:hypothetical protein HMPREF0239_03422 [Clostridium sp. ATCC BAA-442]
MFSSTHISRPKTDFILFPRLRAGKLCEAFSWRRFIRSFYEIKRAFGD